MKTKVLIGAIFVLMVGGFGREAVYEYQRDSMIQANPGIAAAKIIDHETYTKRRRGRETTTYTIRYAFEVEGKAYEDAVSL